MTLRDINQQRCTVVSKVVTKLVDIFTILPQNATKLEWKILMLTSLSCFALSLHTTIIASIITEFLRHLGVVESNISYFAGLVSSVFYIGACLGAYTLGLLSDKIGRKPVFLFSLFSGLGICLFLAYSSSVYMLGVARLLAGFFSGCLATTKAVIGDVSDESNIAVGFAFYLIGWGCGMIFGSATGGLLSAPCKQYPAFYSSGSEFCRAPFLLPCLVVATINVLAVLLVAIFLPETKLIKHSKQSPKVSSDQDNPETQKVISNKELVGVVSLPILDNRYSFGSIVTHIHDSCPTPAYRNDAKITLLTENSPLLESTSSAVLSRKTPIITIALFSLVCFGQVCQDDLIPVWVSTDLHLGGLNYTTNEAGLLSGFPAPFAVLSGLYFSPALMRSLGARPTFVLSKLVNVVTLPSMTLVNKLSAEGHSRSIFIMMTWTIIKTSICVTFIAISCILTRSVLPQHNGYINGVSTSLGYFVRILGPPVAGYIFSWSLTPLTDGSFHQFPFDFHLVFFFITIVCLITVLFAVFSFKGLLLRP